MAGCHAQNTLALFDNHQKAVFINEFNETVMKLVVFLGKADSYLIASVQRIVELRDTLAIDTNAPPLQGGFNFRTTVAL